MRRNKILQQFYRTGVKAIGDGVTDLSSSIAFYMFFAMFPFVLALLSTAGMWLDNDQVSQRFETIVNGLAPQSSQQVMVYVEELMQARGVMGSAGILALLWSASAGFGAISRAINRAQGKPKRHNYLVSRIQYFTMAIAVSLLVLCSVAISGGVELLFANDQQLMTLLGLDYGTLGRVGFGVATFAILVLVFALIYRTAPNEPLPLRHIWPGAVMAALFNELAKYAFFWYVGHAVKLQLLFGSLTTIMTLLMWFYIVAFGLIVGFELNLVLAADSRSNKSADRNKSGTG